MASWCCVAFHWEREGYGCSYHVVLNIHSHRNSALVMHNSESAHMWLCAAKQKYTLFVYFVDLYFVLLSLLFVCGVLTYLCFAWITWRCDASKLYCYSKSTWWIIIRQVLGYYSWSWLYILIYILYIWIYIYIYIHTHIYCICV